MEIRQAGPRIASLSICCYSERRLPYEIRKSQLGNTPDVQFYYESVLLVTRLVPSPREWSNAELRKIVAVLQDVRRVVNVSGWLDQDKCGGRYRDYFPNGCEYLISNYGSDKSRGDVSGSLSLDLQAPLPVELENRFDVAFSHTVLEHVADPIFAFNQIAKMSNDIVITVVPFKQKLHFEQGYYGDYFRFTPFSMRAMHERNGLDILYEEYTPRPSLDVYLFYVATKKPAKHARFPRHFPELADLNEQVGEFNAANLLLNVVDRFLEKYLR